MRRAIVAASMLLLACHTRTATNAESREPDGAARTAAARPAAAPVTHAADGTGEGYAAAVGAALVGRRAPEATLELLDGGHVALADLLGRKPIYLKFWATWCKPCREQMPHLEAAVHKYGDRVAVYAVDLGLNDPIETVRAFRAEHKLTVPIAVDGDGSLAERFGVAVTPLHVLVDRGGVVRYVGHEANAALDAALDALLGEGGAPSPPARRAESAGDALTLTLRDGSTFTLAAHAGKPVALTFVTTWCDGYLANTRPAMAEACAAHARQVNALRPSHQGITWVTVAHPVWTSAEDLDGYVKRFGDAVPIGIDVRAAWFQHFHVRDVATTILLDGRGGEVARVGGRGDDLAAALARLPAR